MVIRRFCRKLTLSSYISSLSLIVALVFSLIPSGCQEPIQPNALTVPTDVTVRVEDGNGNPVSDARVEFVVLSDNLNSPPIQFTDSRGLYQATELDVPVVGENYYLRVIAPFDDPELAGQFSVDTVLLPCRDTTLTVVFVRSVEITCGQSEDDQRIALSTCLDSNDTGILSFVNVSGVALDMSVSFPGLGDVVLETRLNDQPQNSPFNLRQGERITLHVLFAPSTEVSGGREQIVVQGLDQTGALCFEAVIDLSATVRPCDSTGTGICQIDQGNSTVLRSAPDDSIRARTDSRAGGTLCVENIGDGDLTVRASQVLNSRLFSLEPSELTIPPGESDCFTVIFAPISDSVWPGERGNGPARTQFTDSIFIEGCDITIEVKGVADTTFPAIINNCRTPYSYRNQRCGDRLTESDQIITECDKDSTEFDWYVDVADPVSRTGRLRSENGLGPFKPVLSNYVPPSSTGFSCSDPAISTAALAACEDAFGWTNAQDVSMGDVILFRKGDKCWILFINSINDANVESKPLLCYDICRLR